MPQETISPKLLEVFAHDVNDAHDPPDPDAPPPDPIADALLDILLASDELLNRIRAEDAAAPRWLEEHVKLIYDEADAVLQRLLN